MLKFSVSEIEKLPDNTGVFCCLNETNQTIYVGVVENFKQEMSRLFVNKDVLRAETEQIELIISDKENLIKVFAETIRARNPIYNFNLSEQRHFPHFKITNEKFPRLRITRKIENDRAEYFGAFLPETGARLLLDFLNRTFRLRSCTIKIDGDFPVPCTQHYEKRCVAPCVESLCDKPQYDEIVKLTKLFLADERENLEAFLARKIETAAGDLNFETAGIERDFLQNIQNFWSKKQSHYWLAGAVDSFAIDEKDGKSYVYLVSQRGRKVLGKRVFVFEKTESFNAVDVLSQIIWQIYEYYAPKEIRVSADFLSRKFLAKVLSLRNKRQIKINVAGSNRKITTERAFGRTKFEFDFRQIKPLKNFTETQNELAAEFALKRKPKRIEAFDVAHISGTDFVAAKSVWEDGKFLIDEYRFWLLAEKSELEALEKGIVESFAEKKRSPDLILIDGGKTHLNAALKAVRHLKNRRFHIFSAVKPARKHNEISHFITENGAVIKMKPESETFQTLVRLRDEVHDLANSIHRRRRDTSHFYELAALLPSINEKERRRLLQNYGSLKQLKSAGKADLAKFFGAKKAEIAFGELRTKSEKVEPLIVPIRFDEENGDARDLQPIQSAQNR